MVPASHESGAGSADELIAGIAFARRLMDNNDLRQAAKLLEKLVAQTPDPEALVLLAKIEMERPSQQPQALEHLRLATAGNPQLTEAWLMLANYWSSRGQPDKQRRCLERILAYDPRNRDARDALEFILTRR